MKNKIYIFSPMRWQIAFLCGIILLAISINVYYLTANKFLFLTLFLLSGIFIFLFMPFLKNQKLLIEGNNLIIFTFGKKNRLRFSEDIEELVVKDNEIVSFRFNKDGKYYQISPDAYYDSTDLKEIFKKLLENNNINVSVVEK